MISSFARVFDHEIAAALVSRREALRRTGRFGLAALAAGAVPAALHNAFAHGQNAQVQAHEVLNFALTLEYLEDEYYRIGLDTDGLIPPVDRPVFEQISRHETAHVAFLSTAIQDLGETPVEQPAFDFTAGGTFDPFESYSTFLTLSQGFEDTGVRAYKGQAPNLYSEDGSTNALLTAALQIHSVEARHAAEVRRLRGQKPWIVLDNTDAPALQPVYAGEQNLTQGGVDLGALLNVPDATISEAFDEPLTMDEVLDIANLFIMQ